MESYIMVNEKKKHKVEAPEQAVQLEAVVVVVKGERGPVGEATASLTIKSLWHAEHHTLVDYGNKHQQRWVKRPGAPSLKAYASKLAAGGSEPAINWFSNKSGGLNVARTDAKLAKIALEAQATSSSRKKAGNKPSKAAAPVATGNGMAK